MSDTRLLAVRLLSAVLIRQQSLSQAFKQQLAQNPDESLSKELCFGVLRRYWSLQALLNTLLKKPCSDKDIEILLLVGIYQLLYTDIKPYAAVNETVAVTSALGKRSAKGLVNAVLRNFLRSKDELVGRSEQDDEVRYNHPAWFIKQLKKAWPSYWDEILMANNKKPPFSLRVKDPSKLTEYMSRINADTKVITCVNSGFNLYPACSVFDLPGFSQGEVSVQDGAAQLAANLLDLQADQHVLDACCAPGGKTTHMLELQPSINMLAVDIEQDRLDLVQQNLDRCQLQAQLVCADVSDIKTWHDGKLFDRILLDAPCSATGVIRRHPDIKHHRKKTDIDALTAAQSKLLTTLWSLLKPGGKLLYATCSVLPKENHEQISCFLSQHDDAIEVPINLSVAIKTTPGYQILPGAADLDGFFYALLLKKN